MPPDSHHGNKGVFQENELAWCSVSPSSAYRRHTSTTSSWVPQDTLAPMPWDVLMLSDVDMLTLNFTI